MARPIAVACLLAATGCTTSVGPSRKAIERAPTEASLQGIHVVEIRNGVGFQGAGDGLTGNFATNIGDAKPIGTEVGVGDALEVTIWDAAPAALFGTANLDTRTGSSIQTSRPNL